MPPGENENMLGMCAQNRLLMLLLCSAKEFFGGTLEDFGGITTKSSKVIDICPSLREK